MQARNAFLTFSFLETEPRAGNKSDRAEYQFLKGCHMMTHSIVMKKMREGDPQGCWGVWP